MLSRLAAAVSRRTRQRPAETTKVAVQPPQDASEVQLAQLRARYHLPMASVAELLGFVEKSGDGDTKRGYETLLAIRQRRSANHSGEQELGTHCDRKGEKTGARHEWPWYWRFRQPGCDDAYAGQEIFPALLPFDVETQCKVVSLLQADPSALRAGLKSYPVYPNDAEPLQRWHELVDEMTQQYPHVLYYAPGSRANRANRAAAVRSAVHEMVACRLLPDPQAQTETCDMQTDDSAKQKTDGSAKQKSDTRKRVTEEIVHFTCVADAQQALQALEGPAPAHSHTAKVSYRILRHFAC